MGYDHSSSGDSETDTFQSVFATKKSDFGFAYGAGFGIKMNERETLRFDMGYRGIYGFMNIVDGEQSDNGSTQYFLKRAKVRTHSVYVGIALLF